MSTNKESSYDASSQRIGLENEIQRLRDQTLIAWAKESRNLRWFGLREDMSVLELGSGPGFVTEQLLDLVPNGSVTAVEIDPMLIERAQNYLRGKDEGRWRVIEGNIMRMDLPDNGF